jgi:hypothetical protein
MGKGRHRIVFAGLALLALVVFAAPDHRAELAIHAHRQGDRSPEQVQAVVDLGLVAFSFLMTWSRRVAH